ncbi:hypothetical protein [Gemmatimonas sp.]|jgi:hypothetical protein|uniref:hypothetical protein n=2 Tax=Gemmatimonas sp. TaxID=1962908 RepID=UPI00391F45CB
MPEHDASARIGRLEEQLRVQRRSLVGAALLGAVIGLAGFVEQEPSVIRTRGIVIVDDMGRERILIGAPIPPARNRVRTDLKRVEGLWASRYPDPKQYMRWYADYRHTMHGMLVLDENGFDRLAIGDSTPDPNVGKRIGAGPGLDINDAQGFERTGYGLMTVAGKDRVTLGLDSKNGTEGLTLTVRDDGHTGVRIDGGEGQAIFLGTTPTGIGGGKRDPITGLLIRQGERDVHRLSLDTAPPR